MGLRELKHVLAQEDKATLINHLSELYKKYKPVKEYFDLFLSGDESVLLEQYKDKVREGFFPKRGFDLKLSISRKAINNFKKLGTSSNSLADLMLYYVECGVEFTNMYGDIDENFYISMENTYEKALKLMNEEGLLYKFKYRVDKVVDDTTEIGWGFNDTLLEIHQRYY